MTLQDTKFYAFPQGRPGARMVGSPRGVRGRRTGGRRCNAARPCAALKLNVFIAIQIERL